MPKYDIKNFAQLFDFIEDYCFSIYMTYHSTGTRGGAKEYFSKKELRDYLYSQVELPHLLKSSHSKQHAIARRQLEEWNRETFVNHLYSETDQDHITSYLAISGFFRIEYQTQLILQNQDQSIDYRILPSNDRIPFILSEINYDLFMTMIKVGRRFDDSRLRDLFNWIIATCNPDIMMDCLMEILTLPISDEEFFQLLCDEYEKEGDLLNFFKYEQFYRLTTLINQLENIKAIKSIDYIYKNYAKCRDDENEFYNFLDDKFNSKEEKAPHVSYKPCWMIYGLVQLIDDNFKSHYRYKLPIVEKKFTDFIRTHDVTKIDSFDVIEKWLRTEDHNNIVLQNYFKVGYVEQTGMQYLCLCFAYLLSAHPISSALAKSVSDFWRSHVVCNLYDGLEDNVHTFVRLQNNLYRTPDHPEKLNQFKIILEAISGCNWEADEFSPCLFILLKLVWGHSVDLTTTFINIIIELDHKEYQSAFYLLSVMYPEQFSRKHSISNESFPADTHFSIIKDVIFYKSQELKSGVLDEKFNLPVLLQCYCEDLNSTEREEIFKAYTAYEDYFDQKNNLLSEKKYKNFSDFYAVHSEDILQLLRIMKNKIFIFLGQDTVIEVEELLSGIIIFPKEILKAIHAIFNQYHELNFSPEDIRYWKSFLLFFSSQTINKDPLIVNIKPLCDLVQNLAAKNADMGSFYKAYMKLISDFPNISLCVNKEMFVEKSANIHNLAFEQIKNLYERMQILDRIITNPLEMKVSESIESILFNSAEFNNIANKIKGNDEDEELYLSSLFNDAYLTDWLYMPILFEFITLSLGVVEHKSLRLAYHQFKAKFLKINSTLPPLDIHKRDYSDFYNKHAMIIFQLYQIMKNNVFRFLENYMAHTTLILERLLENLTSLPPEIIFIASRIVDKYKSEIFTDAGRSMWESILITLSVQTLVCRNNMVTFDITTSASNYQVLLNKSFSLGQFNVDAVEYILKSIFKEAYTEYGNIDIQGQIKRLPNGSFPKLMYELQSMKSDNYFEIFKSMFICDLFGKSFTNLCHDEKQSFEPGRKLALHNSNIKSLLKDANINIDLALEYKKELHFAYLPEDKNAREAALEEKNIQVHLASVLGSYLIKILEQINAELLSESLLKANRDKAKFNSLHNLKTKITTLLPKESSDYTNLLDLKNRPSLEAIYNLLNKIKEQSCHYHRSLSNIFYEFSDHYIDHYVNQVLKINHTKTFPKSQPSIEFYVTHWNKDDPRTTILGNDVGCCLAAGGGSQFPALVQRRMDDAMHFHVVVEKKCVNKSTNESKTDVEEYIETPIALIWLYFGVNRRPTTNTNSVYVVANFIEIAGKYGYNADARDAIVNVLLTFTSQYTKAIGAEDFLINPLDYGLIPDFTQFDIAEIYLNKVGGCLNLGDEDDDVENRYYLKSLQNECFYICDASKLDFSRVKLHTSESELKNNVVSSSKIAWQSDHPVFGPKVNSYKNNPVSSKNPSF